MKPLHHALLAARCTLQTPARRRQLREMESDKRAPLSVLFYHRVADQHPNAWTLSRRRFRQHIEFCRQHFEIIDLAEVQWRLQQDDSPRAAVALTFDDGYAENLEDALPWLIEQKLPCTYFVSNENIRTQSPFPHDVQAGVPLRVHSIGEVRQLSEAGIEIGCHTRHHVDFSRIDDPQTVRREIMEAKDELEQWIGRRVRYFAFPYGMPPQLTPLAIDTACEAGFDGFCSAYGGYNMIGDWPMHLRRIHGDPEMARLRNWLLFDSRKRQQQQRLEALLPAPKCVLPLPAPISDFANSFSTCAATS